MESANRWFWYPIPGFEGLYEINMFGTIRRLRSQAAKEILIGRAEERYLKWRLNNYGYYQVRLSKDGKTYTRSIHRILAQVFIPCPPGKTEVNHKDGDKQNNDLDNLEWVTHAENMEHARKLGLVNYRQTPVVDRNNNRVYRSAREAAAVMGIPYNTLRQYLNGQISNPTSLSYRMTERRAAQRARRRATRRGGRH